MFDSLIYVELRLISLSFLSHIILLDLLLIALGSIQLLDRDVIELVHQFTALQLLVGHLLGILEEGCFAILLLL